MDGVGDVDVDGEGEGEEGEEVVVEGMMAADPMDSDHDFYIVRLVRMLKDSIPIK